MKARDRSFFSLSIVSWQSLTALQHASLMDLVEKVMSGRAVRTKKPTCVSDICFLSCLVPCKGTKINWGISLLLTAACCMKWQQQTSEDSEDSKGIYETVSRLYTTSFGVVWRRQHLIYCHELKNIKRRTRYLLINNSHASKAVYIIIATYKRGIQYYLAYSLAFILSYAEEAGIAKIEREIKKFCINI